MRAKSNDGASATASAPRSLSDLVSRMREPHFGMQCKARSAPLCHSQQALRNAAMRPKRGSPSGLRETKSDRLLATRLALHFDPRMEFHLVSHWHLAAPIGRVWTALFAAHEWPRWWPF